MPLHSVYFRCRSRGPCSALSSLLLAMMLAACVVTASAEAPQPSLEAPVALHGTTIFVLHSKAPDPLLVERASKAGRALTAAASSKTALDVQLRPQGSQVDVLVGNSLVLSVNDADASAAGLPNAQAYAAEIAPRIREGVQAERRRSAIANTVFSISLVVLFGLITLFLLRKVTDFSVRAQTFLDTHPEKIPAVELRSLEVLGPGAVRSLVLVSLSVGRWFGLLGLLYAWLILSLSLFDSTRGYTRQLTGLVVTPISSLFARIAGSLPLLGVALIAAAAITVLARLVSLFFASVARRETRLAWLPADLAPAASFTLNAALVIAALVFGAPIITGDAQGALAHVGTVALVFLGVAMSPMLACIAIGIGVIFLQRLSVGSRFSYGGEIGRIKSIALTHVHMRADDGSDVFVPHALSLFHATRYHGDLPDTSIDLEIGCDTEPQQVIDALSEAIKGSIEVLDANAARVRYRVARSDSREGARTRLWLDTLAALRNADIALFGRGDTA